MINKYANRFLTKYKAMPLPIKAGFWATVCSFLQRGITMITTPIFTRLLSEEQYGIVSTYFSWQTVLIMITSLSLYKAIMNLYKRYDNKERVLSSVSALSLILTLTWFIIYVIFARQISELMKMSEALTFCLFFTFIFQAEISCWTVYKQYTYDYKKLVAVTLMLTAFSSIFSVLAVVFISPSAESRLIPVALTYGFIGTLIFASVFRNGKMFYNKDIWTFALGFCVPLLPHYLSEFVLQSSDKLMINYMCGSRDVAMYSIAYSVGSLINLVTNSINSSFAPFQYQEIKAGHYKHLAKVADEVLAFVSVMLCLLMLFGKEIVLIFGSSKYLESVEVIIPICIGVYFNYLFQLFARVQEYYEHKVMIIVPSIAAAILNIVTNYIFIRIFGYQAAAYTTFGCYLVFCILHYFFYKRTCEQELGKGVELYDIKGIVRISALTIIAGVIITIISQWEIVKFSVVGIIVLIAIVKRKWIKEKIRQFRNLK